MGVTYAGNITPRRFNRPLYNTVIGTPVFSGESTVEPITRSEVKRQLQMADDFQEQDIYIGELISRVRARYERTKGVSLIARTVAAVLQNEMGNMELPYSGTNTITSALDKEGNAIAAGDYVITENRLETLYEYIKFTYTVVPVITPEIKEELIKQVAWEYQHRGDEQRQPIVGPILY